MLKKNTTRFSIFINHPDYQTKPHDNYRRICRSYEYGLLCKFSFERKTPNFAVKSVSTISHQIMMQDINQTFIKGFYKPGEELTLKAKYDKQQVQLDQIKWGYKIVKALDIRFKVK